MTTQHLFWTKSLEDSDSVFSADLSLPLQGAAACEATPAASSVSTCVLYTAASAGGGGPSEAGVTATALRACIRQSTPPKWQTSSCVTSASAALLKLSSLARSASDARDRALMNTTFDGTSAGACSKSTKGRVANGSLEMCMPLYWSCEARGPSCFSPSFRSCSSSAPCAVQAPAESWPSAQPP